MYLNDTETLSSFAPSALESKKIPQNEKHSQSIWQKTTNFLSYFSLGKYRTQFFINGRQDHGTVLGTAVTLILAIIVIYFSIGIVHGVFSYQNHTLQVSTTAREEPLSLHNLKEFIRPRVTFYSWKEYLNDKAHDEGLNVCGGYECFLNHTKDDLIYIPCNKTYSIDKFEVYQLNSSKSIKGANI